MAYGIKRGQGRGIPEPQYIQDPMTREIVMAICENIAYLLSNPFAQTYEPTQIIAGDGVEIQQVGESAFIVNCTLDIPAITVGASSSATLIMARTEDVPAGGAAEVYDSLQVTDKNGTIYFVPVVKRPTAENLNPALIMFAVNSISSGNIGVGTSPWADTPPDALVDEADAYEVGDTLGTQTDSFLLKKDNTGLITLGQDMAYPDGSTRVKVRPYASAASSYSGPFAVVKKDDTTVTILGYHADESRNWRNYVYAGLAATEVAEQDKGSITTSGYLYLDVTYSSGYSVAVGFATSVPAQSATHYYHPLAWIECADSKISSITQLQYGQIFIAGRVV